MATATLSRPEVAPFTPALGVVDSAFSEFVCLATSGLPGKELLGEVEAKHGKIDGTELLALAASGVCVPGPKRLLSVALVRGDAVSREDATTEEVFAFAERRRGQGIRVPTLEHGFTMLRDIPDELLSQTGLDLVMSMHESVSPAGALMQSDSAVLRDVASGFASVHPKRLCFKRSGSVWWRMVIDDFRRIPHPRHTTGYLFLRSAPDEPQDLQRDLL